MTPSNLQLLLNFLILFLVIFLNYKNKNLEKKLKSKKIFPVTSDEFIVTLKSLDLIILTYRITKIDNEISKLASLHDLDPSSQFNSIKSFDKKVHELYADATKEIIKNHLSQNMKNILLIKYFTFDSLTFYIHNSLKGD